jgi:hypothetical protein
VDVVASLDAPCSPAEVLPFVDDLAVYPRWTDLVHHAEVDPRHDDVWQIELRARLGPLARSKRLRMRRVEHAPHRVEFRRDEQDGRRHAEWQLVAELIPVEHGTTLTMRLHYGGSLWTGGLLEHALTEQIHAGRERLLALLGASA